MPEYFLGFDIGSSSVKAGLVEAGTNRTVAVTSSPQQAMSIQAPHGDWAEQDPEIWWKNACAAFALLRKQIEFDPHQIKSIGIAYQMHGLVCVDKAHHVLRPAIIWCDSRAVQIGEKAFQGIGTSFCLSHLLNSPGNFTASKLKWVKDNERDVYERIHKIMLPGDFIAMKLTGEICTTPSGLSEGIFWDYKADDVSGTVMDYFGFSRDLLPEIRPTFSIQGKVSKDVADETGLATGTPVTYRAGDQPNNALSLGVFEPGEIAATGGTSGVVYGITDKPLFDPLSRVNGFLHVNHEQQAQRIGILLCINGAGSQYQWMKDQVAGEQLTFPMMEEKAKSIAVGSDGLMIFPFGNGAERMLQNRQTGAEIHQLDFNRHGQAHLFRASLEGIAFSFYYGIGILKEMGMTVGAMRVGNDNLFRSTVFSETIATLNGQPIDIVETTGAAGAAKASGLATGMLSSLTDIRQSDELVKTVVPLRESDAYTEAYHAWKARLESHVLT